MKIFEINNYINKFKYGENDKGKSHFIGNFHKNIVEAKYLVERWGKPVNYFLFNTKYKDSFDLFKNHSDVNSPYTIWGVNIHYLDDVPVEYGIVLSLDINFQPILEDKSISMFPI